MSGNSSSFTFLILLDRVALPVSECVEAVVIMVLLWLMFMVGFFSRHSTSDKKVLVLAEIRC